MNDSDDLIPQLQERLAERAEQIDVPEGLADRARRVARRRVARRMAIAGVPLSVVAAGLGVMLTGGGSASRPAVDAAYVSQQVSTQLVRQDAGAAVLYTVDTSPPGTPTAGQRSVSWDSIEPSNHREISSARTSNTDGRTVLITRDVLSIIDRQAQDTTVTVNPVRRTWMRAASCYTVPKHPGPGFFVSDSQLRRLIKSGRFQRDGTTTVAGQPALRLRLKLPAKFAKSETETLYVNVSTYRPIKKVLSVRGDGAFDETMLWRPATAANRMQATHSLRIPAGYRKVAAPGAAETRYLEGRVRKELRAARSAPQRRRLKKDLAQYEHCS